ncbi:M28 family metallopeptidase [Limobrevibacterium gyesilva]|uniref:M28 family metallopeptidase n=1 Tax=Limobrevibacterium gyesilva TaxID=2991712 RepID=A0AA42CEP9_9PROT|nr:M28 family metallopeptidase [Limobrevibacterium gyesilva]MCW3475564.1 M28 family metallopeptidase [Limobrevibacterium gyesilva]
MPDPTLVSLVESVSAPAMMAHLREFARWVKLSGTAEEMESLRYVRARLDEYGFRTQMLLHDAYISLPGPARVTVDGSALKALTHSHSQASPAGGVSGPLVDVGEGTAADFAGRDLRGCIVLAEGIANPAVARRASLAGAAGQLHISPHHHLHEMCISPVWGSPSAETLAEMPTTVACTVSHADGMALRERLARGEQPGVVLHAEVDTGWRKTPILVAEMDGPDGGADEPFVLFSGHHDTWYFGVMDNGAANATMLETARLCASRRGEWARGLRLCFWSGHSHGRYSGSTWYVDEHWDELERRCVAHVNVDSTGGMGATVLENAAAVSELTPLAAEAIRERTGHQYLSKRKSRSSDDSFPGIGIPSMFGALSEQPPGPVKMRNSLGWWWHTPEDTIDKLDEAFLVRDTKVFVHVVWKLLSDAVLPLDYATHARALLAELAGIGAALGGRFALETLVQGAEALRDKAEAVAARAEAAGPEETARINRAIMHVSRALVPVDYSRGDRFAHDPALPQPPWPALQPVRDLAATAPGSDAAQFQTVSAMRARNRVAFALRQANEALDSVLHD